MYISEVCLLQKGEDCNEAVNAMQATNYVTGGLYDKIGQTRMTRRRRLQR